MAVTMDQVRAALDPEEPDYAVAARLGPQALPHLERLIESGDSMLASKATYLVSLIGHERSGSVVAQAAQSDDPAVRVAAAAAARNVAEAAASEVLLMLVDDSDVGVRKVALNSVPHIATQALRSRVEEINKAEADPMIHELSGRILTRLESPTPDTEAEPPTQEEDMPQGSMEQRSPGGEMPAGGMEEPGGKGEMPPGKMQ